VAYDLFRGRSPKNFAIQGHPPLHSHEYVMAGGGYYAPPPRPWRPRPAPSASGAASPAAPAYEVSSTDWEATQRWVANLAEGVRRVRREQGSRILTADEVDKFADLWRRWLAFGSRVSGSGASMNTEIRREWAGLLGEAQQLYERYRLLGLPRVAPPYLGELAVVLATLPPEETLVGMSARLLDASRVSSRLLDQGAPWWAWRRPSDPRPLALAVTAARALARQLSEVARTAPGKGTRDRGSPVYARVAELLHEMYAAASSLYGTEEPAGQVPEDGRAPPAVRGTSLWWLAAVGAAGYLGTKWLIGEKQEHVAGNDIPGYHPGMRQSGDENPEEG